MGAPDARPVVPCEEPSHRCPVHRGKCPALKNIKWMSSRWSWTECAESGTHWVTVPCPNKAERSRNLVNTASVTAKAKFCAQASTCSLLHSPNAPLPGVGKNLHQHYSCAKLRVPCAGSSASPGLPPAEGSSPASPARCPAAGGVHRHVRASACICQVFQVFKPRERGLRVSSSFPARILSLHLPSPLPL